MSESIQGSGENTPRQQYINEFKKSATLFENALKEYQQTSPEDVKKRQEFKTVMDKALHVMSETAMETCRKGAQAKCEKKLEDDYQKFQTDYDSKNNEALEKDYQQLLKDIHDLKNSLN